MNNCKHFAIHFLILLLAPGISMAAGAETPEVMNQIVSFWAILGLIVFVITYLLVMTEDITHLNKSKPVILGTGIIWLFAAVLGNALGKQELVSENLNYALLEYGELFLFLLVAMTYINVLEERHVFAVIKNRLVRKGFGYRSIFWITGFLAFFISPIADNLTTALVMCMVILSVGRESPKFVCLSCINIVVAANAGGAFSPFGDVTTLMVWQKGIIEFTTFFALFVPSLVNFLVPAVILNFFLPVKKHINTDTPLIHMKYGAQRVIWLFLATIATAVCFENVLHMPPAIGMMTGLGYLMFFSHWIGYRYVKEANQPLSKTDEYFNIFAKIRDAEWDTLLFFYGILMAVQGLATFGYLAWLSQFIYNDMPSLFPDLFTIQTQANTIIGIFSAIIDNIPVMFAVLTMNPDMSTGQWLLITLTDGVGGSLLSIGSAAGVAVMGKARGYYTFGGHLKWIWAIFLGYFAGIITHLVINQSYF
jgi:Na+/H+ antiporter NhaD/arsenite permease-like protein